MSSYFLDHHPAHDNQGRQASRVCTRIAEIGSDTAGRGRVLWQGLCAGQREGGMLRLHMRVVVVVVDCVETLRTRGLSAIWWLCSAERRIVVEKYEPTADIGSPFRHIFALPLFSTRLITLPYGLSPISLALFQLPFAQIGWVSISATTTSRRAHDRPPSRRTLTSSCL